MRKFDWRRFEKDKEARVSTNMIDRDLYFKGGAAIRDEALLDLHERLARLEQMGEEAQEAIDALISAGRSRVVAAVRKDELDELQDKVDEFVAWINQSYVARESASFNRANILARLCYLGLVKDEG